MLNCLPFPLERWARKHHLHESQLLPFFLSCSLLGEGKRAGSWPLHSTGTPWPLAGATRMAEWLAKQAPLWTAASEPGTPGGTHQDEVIITVVELTFPLDQFHCWSTKTSVSIINNSDYMHLAAVAETVGIFPCKHLMFGGWLMCGCLGLNGEQDSQWDLMARGTPVAICSSH